jgi:hypothetical protein
MVIEVVAVGPVVIVKTAIVSEPSTAKMAGVMFETRTMQAAVTDLKVIAAKAADMARTKATDMGTAQASHVAAAHASASHVTATAAARIRGCRK